MKYRPLSISGAIEVTPQKFGDQRGTFLEIFKQETFNGVAGRTLDLAQVNCSVSAAGVIRGVHFADVPPGQAKYVTCISGAVLDVVVDLRVGSPTFGRWDSVLLDDTHRRAVFIEEGLGHAFMSLEDDSTVVYLCSTGYNPDREHEIHPFDADLAIEWPYTTRLGTPVTHQLSTKDSCAPTLEQAQQSGLLPTYTHK
ncbi:dTDP-4-dehydrorhamnose 3,5-epimerase [Rhodococcus pyridinivorans]|uniref:dTDP-4-dehydrorhamnose 3,5-epimerase family protein n=1 Tax=Rhodococcus pyridinivorans TaxID=103816 RepID=UPI0022267C5A|nr:dTDP-4-dehydrorhamnose 3,5-epimerase [Rhodococcus pyridinivorans]MCW3468061.1 dTDP-4-dehydrorhamnose 3,5-epimerase [Rhodococcus pyridinivorans]